MKTTKTTDINAQHSAITESPPGIIVNENECNRIFASNQKKEGKKSLG